MKVKQGILTTKSFSGIGRLANSRISTFLNFTMAHSRLKSHQEYDLEKKAWILEKESCFCEQAGNKI